MSWKETGVDWFDGFGSLSLASMSFTEAIIQPVPPDLLFLPMLENAEGDSTLVLWLWLWLFSIYDAWSIATKFGTETNA